MSDKPSSWNDTDAHVIFSVTADTVAQGVYIVWWRNYLGEEKGTVIDAADELDAYAKGVKYLERRRNKKRRSKR